jgi:hypothetical protein
VTCLLALVTAELQRDKHISGQGDRDGIVQQQGGARVQGLNEQSAAVDAGAYLNSQRCSIFTAEFDLNADLGECVPRV